MFRLKRIYEEPAKEDGLRVLVERLWPRGVSKAKAAIDLWLKDLTPSPELREWYHHDTERWSEFRKRYLAELREKGDLITLLKHRATEGPVTLVFAAHDVERSSAKALFDFLEGRSRR